MGTLQQPTENGWMIDETANDGFPFACDFVPDAFDSQNVKSVWDFSADGFPASTNVLSLDFSNVRGAWKIHRSVNDGFPHIFGLFDIPSTSFPKITGFSVSGLGADFKPVSESKTVSLPETVQFQFQRSDAVSFKFPKNQEMNL